MGLQGAGKLCQFARLGLDCRISDTRVAVATEPRMNAPMELTHEDVLRVRLAAMRREHRDLDEAIAALQARGTSDQLTMVRLKKKKLMLKDQIARIEDELTPDIIA